MQTPILVIPDVHSRDFYQSILENTTNKIIFLGDYGDPYSHEGWDDDDTIEAMYNIFEFAKNNPDRVVLLIGNHDVYYYKGIRGNRCLLL